MNNNVKIGVYSRNEKEVSFNFYTSLSAKDKVRFVNFVTDSLVDDNYNYIIKDLIFDFGIIEIFTDLDTTDIHSSHDVIDEIESLLDETNVVEIIKANVDSGVIEELHQAVDYNIEYKTGIHRNVIAESLSNLLDTVNNKISDIDVEGMMEIAQLMSSMSGELTPDKILEAYANSDMYKNQHRQMFADREKSDAAMNVINDNAFKVVKSGKKAATTPVLSPTYEV